MEQLYSAFDVDNNKAIDFSEFVDGLSIFMKGNPEEKLTCNVVNKCVGKSKLYIYSFPYIYSVVQIV